MMMTSWHVWGIFMALCACTVMIEAQDSTWWRVEEYPNPLYQPQACGRHDNVKRGSWICDPNSIITPEDADAIDNLLKQTEAQTRTQCCKSCGNGPAGFVIMVALVPRTFRIVNESNRISDIMYDNKVYSYYLSLYWKLKKDCANKVIILYDKFYNSVFTMTEREAGKVLTDKKIEMVTLNTWKYFKEGKKESIAAGIMTMAESYRDIFRGVGRYS